MQTHHLRKSLYRLWVCCHVVWQTLCHFLYLWAIVAASTWCTPAPRTHPSQPKISTDTLLTFFKLLLFPAPLRGFVCFYICKNSVGPCVVLMTRVFCVWECFCLEEELLNKRFLGNMVSIGGESESLSHFSSLGLIIVPPSVHVITQFGGKDMGKIYRMNGYIHVPFGIRAAIGFVFTCIILKPNFSH